MTKPIIAYCGMTHLGLNSAVACAEHGFETVCFDANPDLIAELNQAKLPVVEPDLDDMLARNRDHITFTSDPADLARCDVVYVAPDIPTDDKGQSDLASIEAVLDCVEPAIHDDAVLVVLSQVNPGFTRARGRAKGPLIYQVETLIFGCAIERAMHPERYIIGCADPSQPLPKAFETYLKAYNCPILPMRYESAELAKISINMCLVASIGVANTMAEVCEHIGADWSEIIPALRLDKRIGQHSYIAPGLGIAGGNLERDLASVIRMAESNGGDCGIVKAWIHNSQHRKNWVYRAINEYFLTENPSGRLALLGLAYKENTHSTKNAPSLVLLPQLEGKDVIAFDPVVKASAVSDSLLEASSAMKAIEGADALIIITPWPEFKKLDPVDIAKAMKGKMVFDPFRVLKADEVKAAGLTYVTLGVAPVLLETH
jgi:UDPglucose 6-dehydrogenase